MIDRRIFLGGGFAFLAASRLASASTTDVRAQLERELISGRPCGSQASAIRGTLARLARTAPAESGRAIMVDIPSQTLTAYDGAEVAFESVVVVGDRGWKTPDLETTVAYVRFNPTWTVPESIVDSRNWREKLAADPGYFERLNFKVSLGGRMVDPEEAADSADRVGQFVQQPGRGNALGRVKLGLNAGASIYLHDTNDKEGFNEDSRALSHGCVRVEQAMKLAAWALGIDEDEARRLVDEGDRREQRPASRIRVATTYFTAWPDADGRVAYYADVYGKDGGGAACGQEPGRRAPQTDTED